MAKKPTSVVNPFEGAVFQAVVDQVVNPDGSIVPVQYLPNPDQVYSLSAEEYADMVDLAEDWFEGDKKYGEGKSMRASVAKGIKRVLGELPSYAKYMAFRACFIQQMLSTGRTLNETSGEQMWLELIGMVKDTCKPLPFLNLLLSLLLVWQASGIRLRNPLRRCRMRFSSRLWLIGRIRIISVWLILPRWN